MPHVKKKGLRYMGVLLMLEHSRDHEVVNEVLVIVIAISSKIHHLITYE